MNVELVERLLLSVLLSALAVAAYLFLNRYLLRRASGKLARFPSYRVGRPALVYFSTPTCAPCKTVQRPVIERLKNRYGEWFQVIEVDASRQPEIAQEWGVMTVPTTFVIDASGKPRYVNQGVATAEKLIQQLELEDFSI
ncbi:MAG: thioredoxin family protein [Anaerolineales bacterium]|nr:thioredoxin family protein [Anaerolineales bacterium]MCX7756019.1 thioredoxin family protein [Anaerolineales bacterium]MDW8277027.1 thioredoxin family protein [Anaerolineales bacterium]